MLEMRPGCERCDKDLPADAAGAMICSFECTFCQQCGHDELHDTCPNCGGVLVPRPPRATALLDKFPAATERTFNPPDGPPGS